MENSNFFNIQLYKSEDGQANRASAVSHWADARGEAEDGDQEDEDDQGAAGAVQVKTFELKYQFEF